MYFGNSESLVTFDFKVNEPLDSIVNIIREHPDWNFSIEETGSKRVLHGKLSFYTFWVPPLRFELQLVDQNSAVLVKGKLFWTKIFHFIQNSITFCFIGFSIVLFGIAIFTSDIKIAFKIILSILGVLFSVIFVSALAVVFQKVMGRVKKKWTELYKQRFMDYLSDNDLLDS